MAWYIEGHGEDGVTVLSPPYYYNGETDVDGPVCPLCVATRLQMSADGEWELRYLPFVSLN